MTTLQLGGLHDHIVECFARRARAMTQSCLAHDAARRGFLEGEVLDRAVVVAREHTSPEVQHRCTAPKQSVLVTRWGWTVLHVRCEQCEHDLEVTTVECIAGPVEGGLEDAPPEAPGQAPDHLCSERGQARHAYLKAIGERALGTHHQLDPT
jgi:hypothetical protein